MPRRASHLPPRPPWRQPQLSTLPAVLILVAACVLMCGVLAWLVSRALG